jgi:hypothetical protein
MAGMKPNKPKPKVTPMRPMVKPKSGKTLLPKDLKGPAAIKELKKQTSKKGVSEMESKAKKALDKKYGWK